MSDDEIQILDSSSRAPNLEDGELPDSPDINISGTAASTVEIMDCDDVQIVEDSDFVLDDIGAGTPGDDEEYLMKSMDTPVSIHFSSGKNTNSRGPGCFNCGGGHNLNDCPEEKNFARIQQNRRSYMENNKMKETRIYQGQLTKFKPGKLSQEARIALGLEDDEYPPWIYKMREEGPLAGYPPGWFERLMPKTDTLEFFTDDPSLSSEKKDVENNFKVDVEQVIFYEGFNDIDPSSEPERALKKHERNYPHYSKEEYASRLGKYVIRQYEQRLREEKEEERRKKRRAADDGDDHYESKRVNESKKKSKKLNAATKKALDSFYNGWINAVEVLQKHEDGEIYLEDEKLRHIKEMAEEDARITEELNKIDEQRKVYGIATPAKATTTATPKSKNKNKKKNALFKDMGTQTSLVTILDDDLMSEFQEFMKNKGYSDAILEQHSGNEPVAVADVSEENSGRKPKKEKKQKRNKNDRNSELDISNVKGISKVQKESKHIEELQNTIDILIGKKEPVKSKSTQKKSEANTKKAGNSKPTSGQASQNQKDAQGSNKNEQKKLRGQKQLPFKENKEPGQSGSKNNDIDDSDGRIKLETGIKIPLNELFPYTLENSGYVPQCCLGEWSMEEWLSGPITIIQEEVDCTQHCDFPIRFENQRREMTLEEEMKDNKKPKENEKAFEGKGVRIDKAELFGSKESSTADNNAIRELVLSTLADDAHPINETELQNADDNVKQEKLLHSDSPAANSSKKKSKFSLKKKKSSDSEPREAKQDASAGESKSDSKEVSPDTNEPVVGNESDQRSPRRIRSIFNHTMSSIMNPIKSFKKSKKNKGDRSDSFPSEEEMTVEDAKRLQNLTLEESPEARTKETPRKEKVGKRKDSKKLLDLHVADPDEARRDDGHTSARTVGDQNMNHPSNSMDVEISESPASPTLPPVVSKYLTDDQAKPEPLVFPLIDNSSLPTADKWAQGITEFKYDNVIEGGRGLHRSIHEVLKNYNNSSK